MTLIQLECFLRAAQALNFTKAAQTLFISRQVVSAHVKALEEELGFPLFRRESKSIALTDSGSILFHRLQLMEQQFQETLEEASARVDSTELSIGVCEMGDDWDWRLFAFSEKHPSCRLNVEFLPLSALEEGLLEGRFDIIISLYDDLTSTAPTFYCIERMRPVQAVIAVSRKHPLAQRDRLEVKDLDGERLFCISTEYSARSRQMILGDFEQSGVWPREVKEFSNYKNLELALANDGVAVTFDIFLPNRANRLKIFPIRQMAGIPIVQLAMAYRRDGRQMLTALADFLRESGL